MANLLHRLQLRRGVKVWNNWRTANPAIVPDLRGVKLLEANLTGIDLHGAALSGAEFHRCSLSKADLRNADLFDSDLFATDLSDADLSGSDLRKAHFSETRLHGSDLRLTQLQGAYLSNLRLARGRFASAVVDGTWFTDRVDFREALELEDVIHQGPSQVALESILLSEGKIPSIFLRRAGLPEPVVEMAARLAVSTRRFHSCFISYSTKDAEFAERLHADLERRGVSCWFAPQDLRVGERFRSAIDRSIRGYDRLLLLLSRNSIDSPWVEVEVETAFEEERRNHSTLLFPIRLDEAVMTTSQAWAAHIRRTRHIGDFSGWDQVERYESALATLLRDLRTDQPLPSGKSICED